MKRQDWTLGVGLCVTKEQVRKALRLACRVEGVNRDEGEKDREGGEEMLGLGALSMWIINHLQDSGSQTAVGWGARCPGTARKEGTI